MQRSTRGLVLGVACHVLLWCGLAAGQKDSASAISEPEKFPPGAQAEAPSNLILEELPVYLKDDETGDFVLWPGWTIRDFEELLRAEGSREPEQSQPYAFHWMTITGAVKAAETAERGATAGQAATVRYADLTIKLKIWTRDEEVRVPLRLDQARLLPGGEYVRAGEDRGEKGENGEGTGEGGKERAEGRETVARAEGGLQRAASAGASSDQSPGDSGAYRLDFEEGGEGYVVWISGKPGQQHEVSLRVLVPLRRLGDETQLRLFVPRCPGSQLKLFVPEADAVGEVPDAATLVERSPGEKGTDFTVTGFGGELAFTWREADTQRAAARPVLEAEGTIVAQVERNRVTTVANLKVSAHGAAFDRFQVRLPKGAELIHDVPTGYAVRPAHDAGAAPEEVVVEVQRAEKSIAPMEVRLSAKRSQRSGGGAGPIELGGFEVLGAPGQWGSVAVTSVGDWHVWCTPGPDVGRIEELPEPLREELGAENVVGRFAYYRQPFSLTARVMEIEPRVRVEPEYEILVEKAEVQLAAKLKYTIHGAKIGALDVELPGWHWDEVEQTGVVDLDRVTVDRVGMLSMPLVQPMNGTIEVTLRAHQAIESGASSGRSPAPNSKQGAWKTLRLELPRPRADLRRPAEVVIQPADNVTLVPKGESRSGLSRQPAPAPPEKIAASAQTPPPNWQQASLYYRADAGNASFVADFRVEPQAVRVAAITEIELFEQEAAVRQRLDYEIAHEPLDRLAVRLPRSLIGAETLEFQLDGQPVSAVVDQGERDGADGLVRAWIVLPTARIGKCTLDVAFRSTLGGYQRVAEHEAGHVAEVGTPSSSGMIETTIPLVMPEVRQGDVDVELLGQELRVTASEGVGIEVSNGPWTESSGLSGGLAKGMRWQFSTSDRTGEVALRVRQEDAGATVVERAWVQTWLTSARRRERAVFRFTTDRKKLELILPTGVDRRGVQLFLGRSGEATPALDTGLPTSPGGAGSGDARTALDPHTAHTPEASPPGSLQQVTDRKRLRIPLREGRLVIPLWSEEGGNEGEQFTGGSSSVLHRASSTLRRYWLEVEYDFATPRSGPGRLLIELPRLGGEVRVQRMYWQLVLPRTEHVIVAPEGFTPEFNWGWNGAFWGRIPLREQAELEAWSGARPLSPVPEATSRYLFSSLSAVTRCDLRTASRWWIVLGASSVALGAGLLLIYVPRLRHPATLLIAAVLLFAVAMVYPGPVLLAIEASSVGLALALVAGLLYRIFARDRHWVVRPEVASSVLHRGSTQTQYRPAVQSSQGSTESAPAAVPVPATGSHADG